MIRSVGSRKASKYKEYIQGCISVLFSYMVGNVMRSPAGQVRLCCRSACCFSAATTSIIYHRFMALSTDFLKFFKNFFQSSWPADRGGRSEDKKMKRTILIDLIGPFHLFERRKRDLNPRAGFPTYTLSRGASSAS